jgi:hypothetical protein
MYRYGMGFYRAKTETMQILRKMIDDDNREFLKIVSFNRNKHFDIQGDFHIKSLNDDNPDEIKDWYDRKNLYVEFSSKNLDEIYSSTLINNIIRDYKILTPFYKFLLKIEENKTK